MANNTVKLKEALNISSHEAFLRKLRGCGPLLDSYSRATPSEEQIDRVFSDGNGISAPFDALKEWAATYKRTNPSGDFYVEMQGLRRQVFEDARLLIPDTPGASPGSEYFSKESTYYLAYIRSIHERLMLYLEATDDEGKNAQAEDAEQQEIFKFDIFPLLRHFCECILRRVYKHDTSLIFGLQLQLEIFRSFRPREKTVNCRALALKLTKEVQHALRPLVQMAQAFRTSMDHLSEDLPRLTEFNRLCEDFLLEKRWDLYHQSPWTAGSNMMTFLVKAIELGMGLCCNGGVLGAVLHLYHCLRYKNIQDPILVFDHLVEVLSGPCFPGGVPKSNFCSSFLRFLGGKIDFARTGVRETVFADKAFTLDFPKTLPHETDLDCRLKAEKLSVFYALDVNYYNFRDEDFKRTFSREQRIPKIQRTKVINAVDGVRIEDLLGNLKSAVSKEFLGELPLAKINWFAVYATCRKVLDICLTTSNAQMLGHGGTLDENPFEYFETKAVDIVAYTLHMMDFTEDLPKKNPLFDGFQRFNAKAALVAFQSVQDGGDLSKYLWSI